MLTPFLVFSPPCLVQCCGNSTLCSPFLNCFLPTTSGPNPSGTQLGKPMLRSQEAKQSSSVQTRTTAAGGGQGGDSWKLWGGCYLGQDSASGPVGQGNQPSTWALPSQAQRYLYMVDFGCREMKEKSGPVRLLDSQSPGLWCTPVFTSSFHSDFVVGSMIWLGIDFALPFPSWDSVFWPGLPKVVKRKNSHLKVPTPLLPWN